MFSVTSTNGASRTSANIAIRLCLNGIGPVSCQDYNAKSLSFIVRTLIANHNYPNAGIKILTPGYVLSSPGPIFKPQPTCTPYSNGYCLFPVSNTSPFVFTVSPTSTQVAVNLQAYFSNFGQTVDNESFSCTYSLDGGASYSQNLLSSTPIIYNGTLMALQSSNNNTQFNAIQASGHSISSTAISLPHGYFSKLNFVGTGVNGDQPNQSFTVTYTDNSTTVSTISLDDWASSTPSNSIVKNMAYRNDCLSGSAEAGSYKLYGYTIALDPTKTVKNIILPNNDQVYLLAISLA